MIFNLRTPPIFKVDTESIHFEEIYFPFQTIIFGIHVKFSLWGVIFNWFLDGVWLLVAKFNLAADS